METLWQSILFGLPTGVVVLLVVLIALGMFWGAEKLEQRFGGRDPKAAPRWRYMAAATLLAGAVAVAVLGQPTTAEPDPHLFALTYTPKVKLELKRAPTSGGCG